ncbi:ABC transporter permease [Deinococcus pimensis]|uniref:ABC transporter permease n=1 Tax=Deinococcus pimensis TaxID=309888 RepID=UPI0004BB7095
MTLVTLLEHRPSRQAANISLVFAVLAAVGLFLFPYATVGRGFGGASTLLLFPGRTLDLTGFPPQVLPAFGPTLAFGWAALAALAATAVAAVTRARWLWLAGLVTLALGVLAAVTFETATAAVVRDLVAGGTPLRRIPQANGAANLGIFTVMLAGLVTTLAGISGFPAWYARLNRLRAALVPLVAIALAVVIGAVVVLVIQPVPSSTPAVGAAAWYGKIDLVWFVYTTLFAPLADLGDFFQALTLATPLIFAGLAVAFAFRAGLFNIGAPGQIAAGAILAMLVGVYLPVPGVLHAVLTVIAAALGGALWGAIPGFLKARFGSSEVINTIMLNYIASAIFIFLISSNTFPVFGRTFNLPFKPQGVNEAVSQELRPDARLAQIPQLLGLQAGQPGFVPLAPLAALVVFAAVYAFLARNRRRLLIALGAAVLTLPLTWTWLGVRVNTSFNLAGSTLNLAFLIALAAVVFFAVFLWRTSGGYALRAVGLSPKAAEYGGINVARSTVLAMTIAGAFAGLASTHYLMGGALAGQYRLTQNLPYQNVGFDGITVALMGQSTPAGVVAAAVLFGTIDTGGLYVDQQLDAINKDIVTVLKALIVLFIAAGGFLPKRITNPPPAVLLPNLARSSAENRETLGNKAENTSAQAGEGPPATEANDPRNDGRDA